ncbi:MAG TPA: hypothetical protein VKR61_16925 [Bryobacteraceae bacterium]|nr:hypothetical protein [Bryobacteraceae bacterium]
MPTRIRHHLTGESLEQYSLRRLSPANVASLEEHLLLCEQCRIALNAIEPYNYVHFTADGPVYSRVTRLRSGDFAARHWGRRLDGGNEFRTSRGGKAYLIRTFSQMFPEHVCTKSCGFTRMAGPVRSKAGLKA